MSDQADHGRALLGQRRERLVAQGEGRCQRLDDIRFRFCDRIGCAGRVGGSNIVEFNSTTGASATEPGTGRTLGAVPVPEAIDFSTSYYWVQLELVRSSTSCIPLAVGVYLAPLIIIP